MIEFIGHIITALVVIFFGLLSLAGIGILVGLFFLFIVTPIVSAVHRK